MRGERIQQGSKEPDKAGGRDQEEENLIVTGVETKILEVLLQGVVAILALLVHDW